MLTHAKRRADERKMSRIMLRFSRIHPFCLASRKDQIARAVNYSLRGVFDSAGIDRHQNVITRLKGEREGKGRF